MAFKRSWPIIGQLALCLACHQLILSVASLKTTLNNDKQTSGDNQKVGQRNQSNEQALATLDEILRDTHQLLDSLDRKLDAVDGASNNKSQLFKRHDAEARTLREFADQNQATSNASRSLDEEHRLTSLAEGFSPERRSAAAETADSLQAASSELEQQQQGGAKRARQLVEDTPPSGQTPQAGSARLSDNQFTEKHIHFSLNLMRAVFSSHSSEPNSIDSFLISPVSIQTVLMMMHLGARGQTRRELANCLHLTAASSTSSVTSAVARDGGSQSSSNSTSLNKDSKLFRRHQQQPSLAGGNPRQAATVAHSGQHQQLAGGSVQRVQQQFAHSNKQMLQELQQAQGNTFHEQFGSAMRQLLKDPSVMKALSSANQIFLQRDLPLSAQFEWAVKNYYGTDLKQVDFQNQDDHEQQQHNRSSSAPSFNSTSSKANNNNVRLMINEWVERQTKGKISNFLMSPVPSSTLLMALNLVFFKGDWQYKFDPADTQPDGLFSLANGRTVKVPMMVNKLPLAHAHDPQMKASLIELPYKAQRLSLFILLPDETNGVFDLMRQLTPSSFAGLISKMRKPSCSPTAANSPTADSSGGGINVRIPKFTIESAPRMSQLLSQQLGLKTLFAADLADLSGMFQQRRLKTVNGSESEGSNSQQPPVVQVGLDELLHKAVLEVHEQGSVAAAASAVIVERVGVFNGQYFEADHPFLLFLMDKQSGLVLFSGVFAGPQQQQDGGQEQQATRKPAQQPTQTNSTATTANEHHHHNNLTAGRSLRQANSVN